MDGFQPKRKGVRKWFSPSPKHLLVDSLAKVRLLCCPKGFGHSFDGVFVSANVHARNSGYFSNPSPQLLIAGCNNKTLPLLCHIRQTIIGIPLLFAIARNPLKSWILRQPERNLVFPAQFFQFSHDTIRYAGYTLGQETIHHGSDHVKFFSARQVQTQLLFRCLLWEQRNWISIALKKSILAWTYRMLKLIKFVSTRTWYGGPSCSLYRKNKEALACSIWRGSSFFFCANFLALASSIFFRTRVSFGDIIRFATANFLVCLAFPMVVDRLYVDCCRNKSLWIVSRKNITDV